MRFLLDAEQRAFAASLDAMLTAAGTPAVVRAWSAGDHRGGRALWSRVADAGVFALAVPEEDGGLGLRPVELVVAFVELGRHAVPGPLVETVTAAALLTAPGEGRELLPALAAGTTMTTLAPPPTTFHPTPHTAPPPTGDTDAPAPLALDGDAADLLLHVDARGDLRRAAGHGRVRGSLDPARRLTPLLPGGALLAQGPLPEGALALARLTTAAQALGVGLALLERTVAHVRQRTQFGVPVGSFQAVKHRLADARIALDLAHPLLLGAALTGDPFDVAAAKAGACEAAYTTARAALQLHGAIGYTAEYDLSLWLTKAVALRTAWGTPGECRAAVLRER
ncbi:MULTISPECIES: acyl-CoA dehydrogenase family protein [Streptomyces]|uniref:Acyl-CoA dehydrogenase family protein n=1 Tax=Streptomyces doudnae TaxID=3075536 RepID=A0ABD5END6_9ACTN|nr:MULTISPECIES: acyl-CoA dehydrogenase family protein [unclassified Streptomyces]MDT0435365.1 acyl-CoA dehydrogenase family protein [Streptomyces sp. DSM 41981]MYQ64767.1 acyl-CoA dehydrogenase [Streptomyces sp. SID4950]SCD85730.1 Acyl-CoA dehydrogenase [Streptomyces sp. SolWspMP-5a-2]